MAATNSADLSAVAAKLYVAKIMGAFPELAYDLSNAGAVITAVEALTKHRIASITDLNLTVGPGETVQTDTDDNGTIYKATTPTSTVSGNRYEAKNIDVLADIFGLQVIDDTTHSRKIVGQKITTVELPRVVLIIETIPTTSQPTVEKAYVVDTGLTTDIVLNFLDTVRANGVGNTSFTFTTNKNGGRFRVIPTA